MPSLPAARTALRNLRSRFVDILRAVSYGALAVWAVLFLFFPPESFVGAIDVVTRFFWLSITTFGALSAMAGAIFRIDIKLEFPGLLFCLIGPLFYFASQLYYVLYPVDGVNTNGRLPLVVYALLPGLMLLPRVFDLYSTARRLTLVRRTAMALAEEVRKSNEILDRARKGES